MLNELIVILIGTFIIKILLFLRMEQEDKRDRKEINNANTF